MYGKLYSVGVLVEHIRMYIMIHIIIFKCQTNDIKVINTQLQ